MDDVVYGEWVPAGRLVKALVALVLCLCVMMVAVGIQYPFFIAIGVPVSAFILLLFWNYRVIRITITDETLLVRYGLFNRRGIPIGDIVSCEPTEASLRRYGGVGIRRGVDGSRAYTTSLGSAVKLNLQNERPFVFSSNNPEKICSIIDGS